jgi:hypothetical protein
VDGGIIKFHAVDGKLVRKIDPEEQMRKAA